MGCTLVLNLSHLGCDCSVVVDVKLHKGVGDLIHLDIRNIWMLSLLQMFPIVEGFPVAERIQEEKVSQIGQTDIF